MTSRNSPPALVLLAVFLSAIAPLGAQQSGQQKTVDVEGEALAKAQELYASGQYEECFGIVSQAIETYQSAATRRPSKSIARLYGLSALLAYTFRDPGYEQKVDEQLAKGLEIDLDLDLGDPAEVPPFVLERFSKVKAAYFARFSRTARRNAIGAFWALVLEPTVLQNLSLLQPGIVYTFNINESFALDAELRFPLQLPIWNSIRGQLGLIWYPSFRIEKIATGMSFSYTFGLDKLTTYTHSVSLGGRMEFLTRSGFGFVANAELLRADLVIGSENLAKPPTYNTVPFLGLLQVVFANVTIYAFYAF